MKNYIILIFLLTLGCYRNEKIETTLIQTARIDDLNRVSGLIIGVVSQDYAGTYAYNPGIEKGDHCFWDDTLGLIVSIGFDPGKSFKLVAKNNQFKTFVSNGGCGIFDSYSYTSLFQTLVLSDTSLMSIDTLIGHLEYKGIQNTKAMKQSFEKYEDDLKKYCGKDLSYFDTLHQKSINIIGTINLPKCKNTNCLDPDVHQWIKEDMRRRTNVY